MKKNYLTGFIPLFVLAMFSVSVLGVLVFGARIYSGLATRSDHSYTYRTAIGYISTKIDQTENKSAICAEAFGDGIALVLPSEYDGVGYTTKLYVDDGMLCELFSPDVLALGAKDGEALLPLAKLDVTCDGEMIRVLLTFDDGKTQTVLKAVEK